MKMKNNDRLFQLFKWIIIICLFIISLLFVKDVWANFQAKLSSFATYQELRTESPTTVLCFDPYIKSPPTISEDHNIVINGINAMPWSWAKYQKEAFYQMGTGQGKAIEVNRILGFFKYFCLKMVRVYL